MSGGRGPSALLSGVEVKREIVLDRPRVMYRVEEAAELLSLSRDRVYQLIRSNQLRSVQVGKSRRVPARALDDYVARLMRGSAGRLVVTGVMGVCTGTKPGNGGSALSPSALTAKASHDAEKSALAPSRRATRSFVPCCARWTWGST